MPIANDYLNAFFEYLKTEHVKNILLSPKLKEDIHNTRDEMQNLGVEFEFTPLTITNSKKTDAQKIFYIFSGTFYYSFRKDGIWHAIPGDTTSVEPHEPKQGGVVIVVDKFTLNLETVYESFAGNTYGDPNHFATKLIKTDLRNPQPSIATSKLIIILLATFLGLPIIWSVIIFIVKAFTKNNILN